MRTAVVDARPSARYPSYVVGREKENPGEKLIVRNRRASFEYDLGDKFEAGIALLGSEVKMLRFGTADLSDAWCSIEREGMTIAATRLYFKGGRVKVEIALARGKKKADKREAVKEREATREARAAMARGRRGD